jgi:hypothetical protein
MVWDAYRENLDITLPHIEHLVNVFNEYTVITSDHGNALGERSWPFPTKVYGHPLGIRMSELTDIPWLITNKNARKNIISGNKSNVATNNQKEIRQRLEELGYK